MEIYKNKIPASNKKQHTTSYARWENQQNARYYEVYLARDLFGWCLTRIWGRIGTKLGRVIHQPCHDFQHGENQIGLIDQMRKQHGYNLTYETWRH